MAVSAQATAPRHYVAPVTVDLRLKAQCGCKWQSIGLNAVDDGIEHAKETGHTLHITGEVRAQQ